MTAALAEDQNLFSRAVAAMAAGMTRSWWPTW